MCNRVDMRMCCDECGYPLTEANVDTDFSLPHISDADETISQYMSDMLPDSLGG